MSDQERREREECERDDDVHVEYEVVDVVGERLCSVEVGTVAGEYVVFDDVPGDYGQFAVEEGVDGYNGKLWARI